MGSADSDERLSRGAALLEWIKQEGGDVDAVRVGKGPGGVGVFAARDVERGESFFRCPLRCLMRATDAKTGASGDDDDDPEFKSFVRALDALKVNGTPIDDRVRLQLHLLNECRRGAKSRWEPYIASLPGDELVANLPISWDDETLTRLLQHTPMHAKVKEDKERLRRLSRSLAKDSKAFPLKFFGADRLLWAHAVYWSRAIRLKLPGGGFSSSTGDGKTDCLVPLLDSCNHEWRSRHETGRSHGTQSKPTTYTLDAGIDVTAGDELCINYGMKDNGELLTSHGFVVREHAKFDFTYLKLHEMPCATRVERWRERLEAVRKVVGAKKGSHAEVNFQELPGGAGIIVGKFVPVAIAVARVLCAPSDEVHDRYDRAMRYLKRGNYYYESEDLGGLGVEGWNLRALARAAWRELDACFHVNGIAKSLGDDEVGGARGEAWESTPGDGARDACALYVQTQMKLLRHASSPPGGTERDEEPKVRGILGEKRDRDDESSDSDIWDHDSDSDGTGSGSREDDCREDDELYEKIADLPPRGWW